MKITYPLLIDGGLSNELEKQGCDLNHPLWTARILDTDPNKVINVHLAYLRAGAQCITTMGYQASITGLRENGYSHTEAIHLLRKSVQVAEEARAMYYTENPEASNILIAASIGPYGAYLADGSEYKGNYGVSKEVLIDFHRARINILEQSGTDLFAFETFPDYEEAKVIASLTKGCSKPSWISFSTLDDAHISDGTSIEKCARLFAHHPIVFAIGVNCLPPSRVAALIKRIKSNAPAKKVIVYPNSGDMYDASSKTWKTDEDGASALAHNVVHWIEAGADIIGGCCRIGPDEINKMRNAMHPNP